MTTIDVTLPVEPPSRPTLLKYGFGTGLPYSELETTGPEEDWRGLLATQGGTCPICGKVPNPNKTTGKVRFVIDHEHVRGWKGMAPAERRKYVRGLTCWFCNHAYLGRGITIAKAAGVLRYLTNYAARRPE